MVRGICETLLALFCAMAAGCATSSAPVAAPVTSGYDMAFASAVLEVDEQSDKLVGAAHFDAIHPELRTFGDQMAHRHEKRSSAFRQWTKQSAEPKAEGVVLGIPCATARFERPAASDVDAGILDALIQHRTCLLELARDARKASRDPQILSLAVDLERDANAELQQLREWKALWAR